MSEIITGPNPAFVAQMQQQQQPNQLEQMARLMQLKNEMQNAPLRQQMMQQQVQAGQQQLQSGQLDLQQKQIAVKDQQAMSAAMQEWGQPKTPAGPANAAGGAANSAEPPATPNYEDLIGLAKKHGASFSTIQGLQKTILDMKDKASSIAKNDAQAGSANATALKTKNGIIADAMNGVMSLPDEQLAPGLLSAAKELAGQGLLDPQHIQMAQQLAQSGNPGAIRQQLDMYAKSLGGFSQMLTDAQKKVDLQQKQGKGDPNSPFYDPSATSVAMGTAPGASRIQAGQVKQAARVAGADAAARQPYQMSLQRQEQALRQGDPEAAGQLMVSGDATLAELKSRGATPDFIAKALFAAHRLSGGKYNAQAADAQFDVAKSPTNVQFFGSAKSLTSPGGTLDQLAAAAKDIPSNQLPVFNSIADAEKAATGSGPIARYASVALGVADDYAKVMGGGQGSDASRTQALNLIAAKQSPEQRAGSIAGIRGAVGSQITHRIGANPVLQRMYGGDVASVPSGGAAAPKDGTTKVNAHGDKIVFKGGQWQLAQ